MAVPRARSLLVMASMVIHPSSHETLLTCFRSFQFLANRSLATLPYTTALFELQFFLLFRFRSSINYRHFISHFFNIVLISSSLRCLLVLHLQQTWISPHCSSNLSFLYARETQLDTSVTFPGHFEHLDLHLCQRDTPTSVCCSGLPVV